MKRLLLIAAVIVPIVAAPAHASDPARAAEKSLTTINRPSYPQAVTRALRYLPADGYVLHYSRASPWVTHVKMAQEATLENDPFGIFLEIPDGALWITVYTVRYRRDGAVSLCVGGLGEIRRFPSRRE